MNYRKTIGWVLFITPLVALGIALVWTSGLPGILAMVVAMLCAISIIVGLKFTVD